MPVLFLTIGFACGWLATLLYCECRYTAELFEERENRLLAEQRAARAHLALDRMMARMAKAVEV